MNEKLTSEAISLLKRLIETPSISGQEEQVAQAVAYYLSGHSIKVHKKHNNIWAVNKFYDGAKPSLLLNSHLDTVKPVAGWTREPYKATLEQGKLFGLGSNDAGASLVSLLAVPAVSITLLPTSYLLFLAWTRLSACCTSASKPKSATLTG